MTRDITWQNENPSFESRIHEIIFPLVYCIHEKGIIAISAILIEFLIDGHK